MPLGFERLNERKKRPNELINFIRPLGGSDEAKSKDYLERVAAMSYPVMKENQIAVMALEEFPPNKEFLGRNFNAGEVIQLVLKSLDGRWLPFRHVQMVMMHELAHCKQMNHSKSFWKVRNGYAGHLQELWHRGYTGEGLWGKGRGLANGAFSATEMADASISPASLCGGVYESRRKRKRKDPQSLSLEERRALREQQKRKRILKKFGAGGMALGADEDEREKLEQKKVKSKPKVASSQRARDLRAAAALARFDKAKKEPEVKQEDSESDTELDLFESDLEFDEADRKLLNAEGKNLVRVCNDADEDNEDSKHELEQLLLTDWLKPKDSHSIKDEPKETSTIHDDKPRTEPSSIDQKGNPSIDRATPGICGICSFQNNPHAPICEICSHVLLPHLVANHWCCKSSTCKGTGFINPGDNGMCSVCGERRK
jgi:DNA-dependent metalloprotease WSS1